MAILSHQEFREGVSVTQINLDPWIVVATKFGHDQVFLYFWSGTSVIVNMMMRMMRMMKKMVVVTMLMTKMNNIKYECDNVEQFWSVYSCHKAWKWSGHRQDDDEENGSGDDVDGKDEEHSDNIN